MNCTVKTVVPHTGGNKWRAVGEKYTLTRQYAEIMKALGKVSIVGASAHGRGSIVEAPAVSVALASETFAPLDTLSTEPDAEKPAHAPTSADAEPVDERASAVAAYVEAFGKKPHHKMSLETILEKVSEAKAG